MSYRNLLNAAVRLTFEDIKTLHLSTATVTDNYNLRIKNVFFDNEISASSLTSKRGIELLMMVGSVVRVRVKEDLWLSLDES